MPRPTHTKLRVPGSMVPVEHGLRPTPDICMQQHRRATCSPTSLPACSLTASPEFRQWLQAQRSPGSSWWPRLASVLLLALVLCAGCLLMPQPDQLSTPETATAIVEQPSDTNLPQSATAASTTVAHGSQAITTLLSTANELPDPQQPLSESLEEVSGSTEGKQPAQPQDDFSQERLSSAGEYAGQQQQPQAEPEGSQVWHGEPGSTANKEQTEQQQDQSQPDLEDSCAWIPELSGSADEGHAVLSSAVPIVAGQQPEPQAEPEGGHVWDGEPNTTADEAHTEQQQDQLQSDLEDSCAWISELSGAADAVLSEAVPAVAGQERESGTEAEEEEVSTGQALCCVP